MPGSVSHDTLYDAEAYVNMFRFLIVCYNNYHILIRDIIIGIIWLFYENRNGSSNLDPVGGGGLVVVWGTWT